MKFSRTHAGMIALVSIFTGMIAPVVSSNTRSYPFPLTDMQWGAYIVLALLVLCFYFVSTHRWRIFGLLSAFLLILLGYLLSESIHGNVHDAMGNSIPFLSWGWFFLGIGSLFLLYTMFAEDKREAKITLLIDHIIGIVGSGTILCLMGLIILMSYTPHPARNHDHILVDFFGSGQVTELSGVTLSPSFSRIEHLVYDRKSDDIHFVAWSGGRSYVFPGGHIGTGNIVSVVRIGQDTVTIRNDETLEINSIVQPAKAIFSNSLESAVMSRTATGVSFLSEHGTIFFPGQHEGISSVVRAEKLPIVAWKEVSGSGYVVMKNNEVIGNPEDTIESLAIAPSGYDTMALVRTVSGEREIMKNGVRIEQVLPGYVSGSFQSNGSHSIYKNRNQNTETIIHDGVAFKNQFEEIREIFLEKNGNAYAFFARPLGEKRYCLFTRFRGNLCGLDGYMNPQLGADGESILFAGYKDGLWSIYRNTDTVIRDTGYHGINIANDYAFFDTTNPKQYLFIEKTRDNKYLYRKNGKIIPGTWEDVSLDVWFGYDNKVITAARDTLGWRVIEM